MELIEKYYQPANRSLLKKVQEDFLRCSPTAAGIVGTEPTNFLSFVGKTLNLGKIKDPATGYFLNHLATFLLLQGTPHAIAAKVTSGRYEGSVGRVVGQSDHIKLEGSYFSNLSVAAGERSRTNPLEIHPTRLEITIKPAKNMKTSLVTREYAPVDLDDETYKDVSGQIFFPEDVGFLSVQNRLVAVRVESFQKRRNGKFCVFKELDTKAERCVRDPSSSFVKVDSGDMALMKIRKTSES